MSVDGVQFLKLPAFDLDRIGDVNAKLKVGDCVLLKVNGFNQSGDYLLDAPVYQTKDKPSESLFDLGWALQEVPAAEKVNSEFRFKACAIASGNRSLPVMGIYKKGETVDQSVARTQPWNVLVEAAVGGQQEPVPMRPPIHLSFPIILGVAGLIALLAIGYGLFWSYKKWSSKKPKVAAALVPVEPPKSEDELALAALDELEAKSPLSQGKFKPHYFKLSEIAKVYVAARFGVDAVESTSSEMIKLLRSGGEPSDAHIQQLQQIFEKLDLVKFTDHLPIPTEGYDLLKEIRQWVIQTRRLPRIEALNDQEPKL